MEKSIYFTILSSFLKDWGMINVSRINSIKTTGLKVPRIEANKDLPEITTEEIQKGIGSLAKEKSPCEDDIPVELFKRYVQLEKNNQRSF